MVEGSRSSGGAEERGRFADAREAAADVREIEADARDVAADLREIEVAAREAAADLREIEAAARDAAADLREIEADRRQADANRREELADARENRADEREAALDDLARLSGVATVGRFERSFASLDRAAEAVARAEARLERTRAALRRSQQEADRDQGEIDRETSRADRALDAQGVGFDSGEPVARLSDEHDEDRGPPITNRDLAVIPHDVARGHVHVDPVDARERLVRDLTVGSLDRVQRVVLRLLARASVSDQETREALLANADELDGAVCVARDIILSNPGETTEPVGNTPQAVSADRTVEVEAHARQGRSHALSLRNLAWETWTQAIIAHARAEQAVLSQEVEATVHLLLGKQSMAGDASVLNLEQ